jgi:hypothetical protein
MASSPNFLSTVDDMLVIRLYGKKVVDLSVKPTKDSMLVNAYSGASISFARIYGAKILGTCQRLPAPLLAIVPDTDKDPDGCDEFADPKEFRMWTLPKGAPIVKLAYDVGNAEEIVPSGVRPFLDVNADFHFHDVQLNGTVISGKLRSYLHLHQSGPFGTTLFDVTVVDRDDTLSFDFNQLPCITVFSIGVASAQVCFHANPNRICGEAVVGIDLPVIGHWGQTFTIACVNL